MSITKIYSDQSRQVNWFVRKKTDATLTITVTQNSSAYDLSSTTFIAEFFEVDNASPILTLTQGNGLTNGGASGILTISLTDSQLNIDANQYFWKLRTTAPTDYLWFNGIFQVNDFTWDGGTDYTVSVALTVAANNISLSIVSASSGGSGSVTSFSAGNLSPLFSSNVANSTTTPALTFAQVAKAANLVFAGPTTGANANPDFRALVAADIPDLSGTYQPLDSDLTAIAALITTTYGRALLTLVNAAAALTNLGATTVGGNLFTLTNPGAVTFPRFNADNTVTARSQANFLNDIFLLGVNTQTADYTLVIGDQNYVVDMNKATAITLTVPPNSSVAFPIGCIIYVRRIGAGTLTIAQGSGVTVTGSSGGLTDPGQNVMMTLRKTATDTWDLQNGIPGTLIDWTPTYTGFSSAPVVAFAKYCVVGKMCTCFIRQTSNGTSNATTFTVTLPLNASNTGIQSFCVRVIDNGASVTSPGRLDTRVNSNVADLFKDMGGAAFTNINAKGSNFCITYLIE